MNNMINFLRGLFSKKEVVVVAEPIITEVIETVNEVKNTKVTAKEIKAKSKKVVTEEPIVEVKKTRRKPASKNKKSDL